MVREANQGPTMRQAEVLTTKLRQSTQSLAKLIFGEWERSSKINYAENFSQLLVNYFMHNAIKKTFEHF
jgi:hypothetical protein